MDINQIWIYVILTAFIISIIYLAGNITSCMHFLRRNNKISKTKKKELSFKITLCSFIYDFIVMFFILFFKRDMQPVYTILDFFKSSFVFVAPVCFMAILECYVLYYTKSISGRVRVVRKSEYKFRWEVLSALEVLLVTSFLGALLIK